MKICFVTDSYPPNIGGAELAIQKIAEGIYDKGFDVEIITTKARERFPFKSTIPLSKITRIKTPNILQRFWFLIFSLPIVLYKGKNADILHGTSYGGIFQTYIASLILRKPAVVTVHEFMGNNWKQFASNCISAFVFKYAEKMFAKLGFVKFIAVSEYTKETLINAGVIQEKISVIYNGESDFVQQNFQQKSVKRKELGIPDDAFVFTAYGRTGLTKGFEYLVDGIPAVLNKINNSFFILILSAGDKNIWKQVVNKINSYQAERILFLKSLEREKLSDYLEISDCIIIPSLSEGFGFTTLEACSLDKIVIATKAGSIPEVIFGKNILINPGKSDEIINACIMAVNGEYNQTEKKYFNWDLSVNNYINVYKEIIN